MRTTSTAQLAALNDKNRRVASIVRIQTATGAWKELSDLEGINWVDSLDWGEDVDQPVSEAHVNLHKYVGATNTLTPLATGSVLNTATSGGYSVLVDPGRRLDIQVAVVKATATQVTATAYQTVFDGEVDAVCWGGQQVTVRARDRLMSHMADRWIEDVTRYGSTGGTAVETVIGNILTGWTDGRVSLLTATSPNFLIAPVYNQQRMSVLQACSQLAQLPGWDLRSKWSATAGAFRVHFFQPDRTAASTDHDFTSSDIFDVQRLNLDREQIRNVVEVEYPSSTATTGRQTITVTASDSIDRYGRRWMYISEPGDSPLDTAAEAGTFASAALADQKDPKADQVTTQDFFWPVEVQDLYGFETDARWYSSQQKWAVYGYRHRLSRDEQTTELRVRGTPAGAYTRWKVWETPPDPIARRRRIPTVDVQAEQNGATGRLTLVLSDPDRTVTKTERALKATASGFGSFSTSWATATGSPGDTTMRRGDTVGLTAKHTSGIKWRVTYRDNELGQNQTLGGAQMFDANRIAEISGIDIHIKDNGKAAPAVVADEDTANIYVTVATSTGTASDPTASVNDGSISGRSGFATTAIEPGPGSTIVVRAVGADANGNEGPVQEARAPYRDIFPGSQLSNAAITAVGTFTVQANQGNTAFRFFSQTGGNFTIHNSDGDQMAVFGYASGNDELILQTDSSRSADIVLDTEDDLVLRGLPTTNPNKLDAAWWNNGVLTRSTG